MKNDLHLRIFWQKPPHLQLKQNKIKSNIKQFLQKQHLSGKIELSVSFISSKRIKSLNNRYRQINLSTDVLSFPTSEKINKKLPLNNLGDIYLCQNFIKKNLSKNSGWKKYSPLRKEKIILGEYQFLIMHGVKHLIGLHHE